MGTSADLLIDEFARLATKAAVVRGGETYIAMSDAQRAVEYFRDRNAVIEGFLIDSNATRPLIHYIADLSSIGGSRAERVAVSASKAVGILSDWDEPEFVSFVIEAPEGDELAPLGVKR